MPKTKEVTIENYRKDLSDVCHKASEEMKKWIEKHPSASRTEIKDEAYKIVQNSGCAASSLAANKYDQEVKLAEKQGLLKPGEIKEAVLWCSLTGDDICKAINGTTKHGSRERVAGTVARLVKQYAEDTTLHNANRDGAEYAWIPAGDSCVYCLDLASNGWQKATSSTAEGNHADHIHPHCDCTFAVRFSKDTQIKGYHPEKINEMIEACEGETRKEKLNSLRRKINAKKNEIKKDVSLTKEETWSKLTIEEQRALLKYKSFESYLLNDKLRMAKGDVSRLSIEDQIMVNNIDSALAKMPNYSGDLVRVIDFSDLPNKEELLSNFLEEHEPGKTITYFAYTSCSSRESYNPTATVQIYIQNSSGAKDIQSIGLDEGEVLFPREKSFVSLEKVFINNVWYILLEEK